jgi:hypothetical protein
MLWLAIPVLGVAVWCVYQYVIPYCLGVIEVRRRRAAEREKALPAG